MPTTAFLLAATAAVVHAGWNIVVARARDPEAATAVAVVAGCLLLAPAAALTWDVHLAALVVGAFLAGAVLALLLARVGVVVTLLEAHTDFNREFRGDTIHPSTLELMDQLGLLERVLEIPHTRAETVTLRTPHGSKLFLDFRGLPSMYRYALRLPQSRFLELLTAEAARYPNFRLVMGARVEENP